MLSGSEILNYVNLTDGYISCCEAKIYSVFFRDVFLPDKYHRPVSRTFLTSDGVFIFCWKVTIQYLHSYVQKSIPDQLRWWDFCLPAYVFLRSAQQVRRPIEQLRWKYLFRYYKELSLLRKNGKMNINKGKIWKQPWYRRKVPFLFRKSAVNAFSCL